MRGDEAKACDYRLSLMEADALAVASLLPADMRAEIFRRYAKEHGSEALIQMVSQFVGLANSVVANNREMIELAGIIEGTLHPERSDQINLPTIFGALMGVRLANAVPQNQRGMCGGCAYRLGTPANQSPSTTADAVWCEEPGQFMCHEDLNAKGEPAHACRGHARATKGRRPDG
jgi:hypothetical protein